MDNLKKRLDFALKEIRKSDRVGYDRIQANKLLFEHDANLNSEQERKEVVDAFFTILDNRVMRKHGPIDYQRRFYYIAENGRLAFVAKAKEDTLKRRGLVVNRRATKDLGPAYGGQYAKHRKVIGSLERRHRELDGRVKRMLETYFDEQKPCKMIIDKKFDIAYAPEYHGSICTDGDLATETSCMSCRGEEAMAFYGGIEGCSVARFETDDGEQVGRCIVYEYGGVRHFIRIYGRGEYHRTMLNLIRDNMKEYDLFGRGECIEGMRLKTNWNYETPSMYLDGNRYGLSIDYDTDTFYVSDTYEIELESTGRCSLDEIINEDDYYTCDNCEDRIREGDALYIGDHVFCCDECAHDYGYIMCDHCNEWFYNSERHVYTRDGYSYCCEDCAVDAGYRYCQECDEWVSDDEVYSTEDGSFEMCKSCFKENDYYTLNENGYLVPKENGDNNG